MTDDFIFELRADWRKQETELAGMLRRLRRHRWTPHLSLAAEAACAAGGLVAGLWFAWMAVQTGRLLFALAAGMMLVTMPGAMAASVLIRRGSLRWEDETPESVLRTALRRAEATLMAARAGYASIAALAAFVALLWIVQGLGLIRAAGFLVFYTSLCALASLAGWLGASWSRRRARRERDVCLRLLKDYAPEVANADDGR